MERFSGSVVRRAQRQQTPVALHNALHGPAQCSDRHATSADIVNSTRAARSRVQHETWQRARCDCRLGESGQIKRRRSSRPKEQLCKPRNLSISPCISVSISYLWHLSQLCGQLILSRKKSISLVTTPRSSFPNSRNLPLNLSSICIQLPPTYVCLFIPAVTVTVAVHVHLRLGPADPPSPYRRSTGHNPCAVPSPGRR